MALNYTAAINRRDIDSINMLKRDKIWLLVGETGDKVVCKCDMDDSRSAFKLGKSIMKSVDSAGARTKTMTSTEIQELKAWAEFDIAFRSMILENRFASDPSISAGIDPAKALLNVIQSNYGFWTKMPAVDMNDIESALVARLEGGDKGPLAEFAKALSKSGGLEQLGKIVAADAIIGNADRFNPHVTELTRGGSVKANDTIYRYKYITNVGNIMILRNGSARTVTGMDFADPMTAWSFIDQTLDQMKDGPKFTSEWDGNFIIDPGRRKTYAEGIAGDLERIVSPHRKPYSPFTKLGRNAGRRIEIGMVTGARDILQRLEDKWRNKSMPAGVSSRLAELRKVA